MSCRVCTHHHMSEWHAQTREHGACLIILSLSLHDIWCFHASHSCRTIEQVQANLECNATSAVHITHHFLRIMVSRLAGCITYASTVMQ